jgi:hypothetical protein
VYFQERRRKVADEHANSSIYVVADEDCIPHLDDIFEVIDVMDRYPQFAILSLKPIGVKINFWTPEDYAPHVDENVMEHVSVGHVRFCRKGALKQWPEYKSGGYDNDQCSALRRENWRVGFLRNFWADHLGEGKTSIGLP